MKSTEHVSNEGTYASIQSQPELSRFVTNESTLTVGKRNPKELIYVKQTATSAVAALAKITAGGHQAVTTRVKPIIKSNSLDCERIKWNPSLGGQNTTVLATNTTTPVNTVLQQHKANNDWPVVSSAAAAVALSKQQSIHRPLEQLTKDTQHRHNSTTAAMSKVKLQQLQQQQQKPQQPNHVENVSKPKLNHSSDAKVTSETTTTTTTPTTLSFRDRLKTEPKQLLNISSSPVNVQHRLKQANNNASTQDIQCRQINGISIENDDEPATATDNNIQESLHKSITNHSTVGNSSLSSNKQNESSKGRKRSLSERRQHKQHNKSDAKSEKKQKCVNGGKNGGGRKTAIAIRQDSIPSSMSRFPVKCSENGTFDSASVQQQQQQPPNNSEISGKRMDKEWHSPESYIYDDISSDTITDSTEYNTTCMQTFWFRDIPNENLLTREQRLENKRDNLRRQAFQYAQAQHFRSTILAKRRLITVTKALAKFKHERNK